MMTVTLITFLPPAAIQSEKLENITLEIADGGLCAWTILNDKNLLINDVASDPRAQKELVKRILYQVSVTNTGNVKR